MYNCVSCLVSVRKKNGNSFYPQVAGHQTADCRNRLLSPYNTAVARSGVRTPEKCLLTPLETCLQVLVYVLHFIWIYLARTTLKTVQNLNVFYCKKKWGFQSSPLRGWFALWWKMYHLEMVDGNVSTGDGGWKCINWRWWLEMYQLEMVAGNVSTGDDGWKCINWRW
jgi:hypothetical protein